MKELKLTKYVQTNATVLDNEFIDQYMVRANGEYVKVYLLLLRHMNQSSVVFLFPSWLICSSAQRRMYSAH